MNNFGGLNGKTLISVFVPNMPESTVVDWLWKSLSLSLSLPMEGF